MRKKKTCMNPNILRFLRWIFLNVCTVQGKGYCFSILFFFNSMEQILLKVYMKWKIKFVLFERNDKWTSIHSFSISRFVCYVNNTAYVTLYNELLNQSKLSLLGVIRQMHSLVWLFDNFNDISTFTTIIMQYDVCKVLCAYQINLNISTKK